MTETCIRRPHTVWTTCPCRDCTLDRRRMSKRSQCHAYSRVPAEAAWQLVDRWTEQGHSPSWIASAAGVDPDSLRNAIYDARVLAHRRAFGPTISAALVACDITTATVGTRTATGTRRRLRALAMQGWRLIDVENATGIRQTSLSQACNGTRQAIAPGLWRAVRDFYDAHAHQPGPSSQAAVRARNKGWLPPMWWDDPDLDPEVDDSVEDVVDDIAIARVLDGDWPLARDLTRAERVELVARWIATGQTVHTLNSLTGLRLDRYVAEPEGVAS